MATENKIKIVEVAEQNFKSSPGIYFTNYTGMNVLQATELRKQFREKNVRYTVVKNTLSKIAAKNAGIEGLDDILLGQIGIAFSDEDPTAPAKVIKDFKKDNDCLDVVGVYFDGQLFDPDKYKELASLPSKEELLGKLVGGLGYPMSTLASALNNLMPKLLTALNEINKQKQ
jgi:large subunit ribosomal protein L10|tara:strand:- start:1813 stop:2328 length:516 start_codon:yes stop_codon:yes gene_type:complete